MGTDTIPRSKGGHGIFSEITPMVTIELLAPGSSQGFVKSERPDRIDEKRDMGPGGHQRGARHGADGWVSTGPTAGAPSGL